MTFIYDYINQLSGFFENPERHKLKYRSTPEY